MPETTNSISGIIYDEYNSPLPNVGVKIFEVDLRIEKLLGQTKTDLNGFYLVRFKLAAAYPEYKLPDIRISILDDDAKILGKSSIYFNTQFETTINYRIGGSAVLAINEFDRLVTLLSPILAQSSLDFDQLEENNDNKDISFLSGETGIKAEKISFLNIAFTLSKSTSIPADFFYGLFSMGFPTDLDDILMIKSASINQAILQAIDQNIISSKWVKELPLYIKYFNALTVNKIAMGNDELSVAFKNFIGTALSQREQKIFLSTFLKNEGNPGIFWDKLKEQSGFSDSVDKEKHLVFKTLTDVQLAEYLYKIFGRKD